MSLRRSLPGLNLLYSRLVESPSDWMINQNPGHGCYVVFIAVGCACDHGMRTLRMHPLSILIWNFETVAAESPRAVFWALPTPAAGSPGAPFFFLSLSQTPQKKCLRGTKVFSLKASACPGQNHLDMCLYRNHAILAMHCWIC